MHNAEVRTFDKLLLWMHRVAFEYLVEINVNVSISTYCSVFQCYPMFRKELHSFAWLSKRSPWPIHRLQHQSMVSRQLTDHTSWMLSTVHATVCQPQLNYLYTEWVSLHQAGKIWTKQIFWTIFLMKFVCIIVAELIPDFILTLDGPRMANEIDRTISKRQAYATEIPNPSGIGVGSTLSSISKLFKSTKIRSNFFFWERVEYRTTNYSKSIKWYIQCGLRLSRWKCNNQWQPDTSE